MLVNVGTQCPFVVFSVPHPTPALKGVLTHILDVELYDMLLAHKKMTLKRV